MRLPGPFFFSDYYTGPVFARPPSTSAAGSAERCRPRSCTTRFDAFGDVLFVQAVPAGKSAGGSLTSWSASEMRIKLHPAREWGRLCSRAHREPGAPRRWWCGCGFTGGSSRPSKGLAGEKRPDQRPCLFACRVMLTARKSTCT